MIRRLGWGKTLGEIQQFVENIDERFFGGAQTNRNDVTIFAIKPDDFFSGDDWFYNVDLMFPATYGSCCESTKGSFFRFDQPPIADYVDAKSA